MDDCLFCAIAQGQIPSAKVFESDTLYAFLDLHPCNKGHTLLIPKAHCQDVLSIDPSLGNDFFAALQRISRAVMTVTGSTGFNLIQNNGAVAGQEILHLHWHIIPRFVNDGFKLWNQHSYDNQEEMERLATALRVQIGL